MSFCWKDEENKSARGKLEGKEWRWIEDEEMSSELIQDHIFRCYDGDKR